MKIDFDESLKFAYKSFFIGFISGVFFGTIISLALTLT